MMRSGTKQILLLFPVKRHTEGRYICETASERATLYGHLLE